MRETGVRSPAEALNFLVCQNPLLHLAPNLDSLIYLYGQGVRTRFPQTGVNVTADSCLGGLAVMMLARNARDRGSIPR